MSHLDRVIDDKNPKKVLSIDGGGIRGLIAIEFLRKIEAIEPAVLQKLGVEGMTVVTHDELSREMRQRVQCAVEARVGGAAEIRFDTAPAMAWGVELCGNGQRIGWTPDAWLDSVEDRLRAELEKTAA